MRTRFLTLLILIGLSIIPTFGRQPQRGYRGFVDIEGSTYFYTDYFGKQAISGIGASTTHGYQFNPHLFVGGGLSIVGNNILPVYIAARTDWKFGIFTPFADLKLGYNMLDGGGVFFSPSVGYRFNWGRKVGINLGAGLTVKGFKADLYNVVTDSDGYSTWVKFGEGSFKRTYLTIRLGIDF